METLKQTLLNSSRLSKQFLASISDFFVLFFSILFSFFIFNLQDSNTLEKEYLLFTGIPLISVITLFILGTYKSILRFIDLSVIFTLIKSIFIAFFIYIFFIITWVLFNKGSQETFIYILDRSLFWTLCLFTSLVSVVGFRLIA